MEKFDVFVLLFILFGVYCTLNINKDYKDYKKSAHYLEYNIFIRNVAVIAASIILIIYKLFNW